jgi:peroxiredoxin Q/BCP
MRTFIRSLMVLSVAAPLAAQSAQQGAPQGPPPPPVVPAAGEIAPDFTLPWADAKGPRAEPVTLSKLRGQVVVLAFYPADFSRGCTIEMSKFRDEYKTLFGDGVTVMPISRDSIKMHARWADTMAFQFPLVSDTAGTVAKLYGSQGRQPTSGFARTVFVVGKDGKIVWSSARFNAAAQIGYDSLTAAVAAAKK